MKLAYFTLGGLLLALAVAQGRAQEAPSLPRAMAALPYLSSPIPEQRASAEAIIEAAAPVGFEQLAAALPQQPRPGRDVLLRVLCATGHAGRAELCVGILCRQDARRSERVVAATTLAGLEPQRILQPVLQRLEQPDTPEYERAQCAALLGLASGSSAQSVAEQFLGRATAGSLEAMRLEVSWLRSILATGGAEPAWGRWQRMHLDAPKCTLRELQIALAGLAQPSALQRIEAETRVSEMLNGDRRVLLALAGSALPERAAFGLTALRRGLVDVSPAWLLDGLLFLIATSSQAEALLAIEVAVACAPPTPDELTALRPVTGQDTVARVAKVMQGLGRGGSLTDLRRAHARISAELRPLLLRRGAMDAQARAVLREFVTVRRQLSSLEAMWRAGWRAEFEPEVLGTTRDS